MFFDKWIFRTIHLCGIIYVSILIVLGKYCPLTILENKFRKQYNPDLTYPGSFVIYYIEKLVYFEPSFLLFEIFTIIIAVFSLIMFLVRPPSKIKKIVRIGQKKYI